MLKPNPKTSYLGRIETERKIETDTPKDTFEIIVKKLKNHILKGDIFQVVVSRTITADYNAEPIHIYRELKRLNPSPCMYYINTNSGCLIGSSPERCLSVIRNRQGKNIVEIRPIAGTRPRGLMENGSIDAELDSRYEVKLRIM